MKYQTSLIAATLALAAANLAQAQDTQDTNWLSETRITIALGISSSTPGIDAKDEAGVVITPKTKVFSNYYMDAKGTEINEGIATITKSRFSNLEFLRYILKQEKSRGGSIMKSVIGWSLVHIGDDDDAVRSGFYIKRKIRGGKFQIINVDEYIQISPEVTESDSTMVSVINERSVYDPEEDTYTKTDTYSDFGFFSFTIAGGAFPLFQESPNPLWLTGTLNFSDTWDSAKNEYKITTLTVSQIIAKYTMNLGWNYDKNSPDYAPAILDGSLTGATSTYITQDAFDQGLQQSNNAP